MPQSTIPEKPGVRETRRLINRLQAQLREIERSGSNQGKVSTRAQLSVAQSRLRRMINIAAGRRYDQDRTDPKDAAARNRERRNQ